MKIILFGLGMVFLVLYVAILVRGYGWTDKHGSAIASGLFFYASSVCP